MIRAQICEIKIIAIRDNRAKIGTYLLKVLDKYTR